MNCAEAVKVSDYLWKLCENRSLTSRWVPAGWSGADRNGGVLWSGV